MKVSPRLILIALALGVTLATLVWRSQSRKEIENISTAHEVSSDADHKWSDTSPQIKSVSEEATNIPPPSNGEERERIHGERMSLNIQNKNIPIQFWGKVVNQKNEPLAGVQIAARVRTWTSISTGMSIFPKVSAISGDNGQFEITGVTGDVLQIEAIQKDGYEQEPRTLRSFGFNTSEQFRSDPNVPVLFRMWETNIHEQLLTARKSFRIEPDGRSYLINLKTGAISESDGGDLRVSLTYLPQARNIQKYEWHAEIEVINGGLVEETDAGSPMYLAPENGYVPAFQYEQQIRPDQRGTTGRKRFFVQLNGNREYGRITVEMFAPYNNQIPGLIRIEYAINPSGSRILK